MTTTKNPYARESAAAQRVSAYVVLNKKGRHVATVQAIYPKDGAGRLQVDVITANSHGNICERTHSKYASGFGYDKFTAALSGAMIDGYMMADHCGRVEPEAVKKAERIMARYNTGVYVGSMANEAAAKIGFRFANNMGNLYPEAGLERLRALGYTVIQAI